MTKNNLTMRIAKKSYDLDQAIKNQKVTLAATLDKELVALKKELDKI